MIYDDSNSHSSYTFGSSYDNLVDNSCVSGSSIYRNEQRASSGCFDICRFIESRSNFLSSIFKATKRTVSKIVRVVKNIVSKSINAVKKLGSYVKKGVKWIGNGMFSDMKKFFASIFSYVGAALAGLALIIGKAYNYIKGVIVGILSTVGFSESAIKAIFDIITVIGAIVLIWYTWQIWVTQSFTFASLTGFEVFSVFVSPVISLLGNKSFAAAFIYTVMLPGSLIDEAIAISSLDKIGNLEVDEISFESIYNEVEVIYNDYYNQGVEDGKAIGNFIWLVAGIAGLVFILGSGGNGSATTVINGGRNKNA